MFHSSKIAQLTEQLEEAQAALTSAKAVAEQAEAKAAELMAQIEAKDATISNLQAELEKANEAKAAEIEKIKANYEAKTAEVEKVKADYEAKIEASVQQKVVERCASAGITEPIASDPKAIENPSTNSHLKGRARVAAAFSAQFSK